MRCSLLFPCFTLLHFLCKSHYRFYSLPSYLNLECFPGQGFWWWMMRNSRTQTVAGCSARLADSMCLEQLEYRTSSRFKCCLKSITVILMNAFFEFYSVQCPLIVPVQRTVYIILVLVRGLHPLWVFYPHGKTPEMNNWMEGFVLISSVRSFSSDIWLDVMVSMWLNVRNNFPVYNQ